MSSVHAHQANAVTDARLEQFLLTERAVLEWIQSMLELKQPFPRDGARAHSMLRNGVLLCQLMQEIEPKAIPRIQDKTSHAWKLRENIHFFLAACEDLKIPKFKIFKISDLYGDIERVNQSSANLDAAAMEAANKAAANPALAIATMSSTPHAPFLAQLRSPAATPLQEGDIPPYFGGNWPAVIQTLEALAKISHSKGLAEPMKEVPAVADIPKPFTLINDLSNERKVSLKHKISRLKESTTIAKIKVSQGILRRQLEYLMNAKEGHTTFEKLERGIIKFQGVVRGHFQRKAYKKMVRDVAFREKVANEILSTEKTYINNLDICLRIFWTPLTDGSKPFLKQEDIDGIFCNIKLIHDLQKPFSQKIEDRISKWDLRQKISDIFFEYSQSGAVDIYAKYVENFDYSVAIMTRLMKTNPSFAQFITDARQLPEVAGLDLSAFLITPVQRIPRYNLLLRDLMKYTQSVAGPENIHADLEGLNQALEKMETMAKLINERKRQSESILRVGEIADSVIGIEINLVEANRYFVKEITLADERTAVFLFNDLILFGKKKGLQAKEVRYSHFFWLRDILVRDTMNTKPPPSLELTESSKGKVLQKMPFLHAADKEAWLQHLMDLQLKLLKDPQSAPSYSSASLPTKKGSSPSREDGDGGKTLSPGTLPLRGSKNRPKSTPITGLFTRSKSPSTKRTSGNHSPVTEREEGSNSASPRKNTQPPAISFSEEKEKPGPAIGFSLKLPSAFMRAVSPGKRRQSSTDLPGSPAGSGAPSPATSSPSLAPSLAPSPSTSSSSVSGSPHK